MLVCSWYLEAYLLEWVKHIFHPFAQYVWPQTVTSHPTLFNKMPSRDMFIAMRRAKSLDRFNSSRSLIPRNDEAGSALEQHFNWANEVHEYRP